MADVHTVQGKSELALEVYEGSQSGCVECRAQDSRWRVRKLKKGIPAILELAEPALPALKQSPDGLLVLATDYLKTGDRPAAAGLAKDWARISDVPQVWSIKFALVLAEGGAVPEAITVLEGAKGVGAPTTNLPSTWAVCT